MQLLLTVNGMQYEVEARPTARLLDVLRDQLGLTGTKEGCAEGEWAPTPSSSTARPSTRA